MCTSTFAGVTTMTYFGQSQESDSNWFITLLTTTATFPKASELVIQGDGMPIWFQSSDINAVVLTSTTSAGLMTSASASAPGSVSKASTSAETTTAMGSMTSAAAPESDRGLSVGAKGGIGAGAAVVVLAIAAAVSFLVFRRRREKRRIQARDSMQTRDSVGTELHGIDIKELHDTGVGNAPGTGTRVHQFQEQSKLPGSPGHYQYNRRSELQGSPVYFQPAY
jgi:hypothetical protein